MPRPYFVADQAMVTVLKPVASSAFGSYKLSVPEDVDINDVHEFAAPGNELGYVASLAPKGVRVGGFARRFVRADVSVIAADVTDPDWVPASDVDKVLTEAAARVEGDFFLESDISKAGLGPWIPFTHFEQGDLATVEIWGRRVPLPVTRIEPKVTDHDENDWAVHVGGQVLTDDEARLAENETLRQAAVQSRREVAGLESQTAKAVSTADSANQKSDQALKAATDADGTIQSKLDEQRQLSSEFSAEVSKAESAADKASQAFNNVDSLVNSPDGAFRRGVSDALAAQDDVNQTQQEINATQSNINRQQGEINTTLSNATKAASNAAADALKASDAASEAAQKASSATSLNADTINRIDQTMGRIVHMNSNTTTPIVTTKHIKLECVTLGEWLDRLYYINNPGVVYPVKSGVKAPVFLLTPQASFVGMIHVIIETNRNVFQQFVYSCKDGNIWESIGSTDGGGSLNMESTKATFQTLAASHGVYSDEYWKIIDQAFIDNGATRNVVLTIYPWIGAEVS